jgi:hypothetical protein
MARVLETWKQRYSNAHIGRVLPGSWRRACIVIEDAKAVQIVELAATEEDYSGGQLKEIAKYVAGRHGMTTAEAQAWKDELLALEASGEYFFSLNRYLFVARRPSQM